MEIRDARRRAGLSQDTLGGAAGLSGAEVGRVERGEAPWLTVVHASRLLGVLGLGLWARTFPFGSPLRDAAHSRLLARFEARLPPQVARVRESPVPGDPPGRAIDLLLTGLGPRIGVEAETAVTDEQSLTRELMAKKADGRLDRILLLVQASARNRKAIAAADGLRRAMPLGTRAVLTALGAGRDPRQDGIVVL
jgi:transcriptional regulator with XRE-family HTH domain